MFQEWIDINYITHENPKIVLEEYYSNNLERENNLNKANAPKINDKNDNVNSFGTVLCKKVSLLFITSIKCDCSNLFSFVTF